MNNLLAQRKEIKRLQKESERGRIEEEEEIRRAEEEARVRAVEEFEKVQIGLERKVGAGADKEVVGWGVGKILIEDDGKGEPKGKKRKFELDEEELLRIAREERTKAKKTIQDEKVREVPVPHLRPRTLLILKSSGQGLKVPTPVILGSVPDTIFEYIQHAPSCTEVS
jgi:nitric oxide synthase-interacting protein